MQSIISSRYMWILAVVACALAFLLMGTRFARAYENPNSAESFIWSTQKEFQARSETAPSQIPESRTQAAPLQTQRNVQPRATIRWNNASGGSFNVATNWTPNQVPTNLDIAVIDLPGTYTVSVVATQALGGLVLGAATGTQTLSLQSGSLTLSGTSTIGSNGVLSLAGSIVSVIGTGTVAVSGRVDWNAGTIGGGLVFDIASTGTVMVGGALGKSLANNVTFNNSGLFVFAGTTPLGVSTGAPVFNNLTSGIFEIQNNLSLNGTCILNNAGLLRKTSGTASTSCNWTIVNSGVINIQTGQLDPLGGLTLNNGTNVMQLSWSNGTVTVAGSASAQKLALMGGILSGSGVLNVGTVMTWAAGSIQSSLTINIAAGADLIFTGSVTKTLSGSPQFNNAGVTTWDGFSGDILVSSGSPVFTNLKGGIFDIRNNATLGAPGTFNNLGTLRKTSGVGTSNFNWALINSGVMDCPTTIAVSTFTQTAFGRLNIEIGGLVAAVSHDRMQVTGRATLNGTLNLILKSRFNPVSGQNFTVLTYGERVGTFASVNGQNANNGLRFNLTYDLSRMIVNAQGGGASPIISNISPTVGAIGSNVVITGSNFTGASGVFFNGRQASSFTVSSPTQITVTVPSNMIAGPLQVVTPNGTATSSQNFAIPGELLLVNAVGPTSGAAGTSITAFLGTPARRVNPKQFGGATSVQFNGTESSNVDVSPGQVLSEVPSGGETGPLVISTQTDTQVGLPEFTVTNDPDLVTQMTFTEVVGAAGTNITFGVIFTVPTTQAAPGGVNLDIPLDATLVDLNGTLSVAAGSMIPGNQYAPGDLTVQRLNGVNGIRVRLVSSIVPATARVNVGTGVFCQITVPLLPSAPPQGTVVTASSQSPFNTNLTFGAPPTVTQVPYTVTANSLSVGPTPTVTQFYPVASTTGRTITIAGSNFSNGTQVFFGGANLVPATSVTVVNSTTLQAVVPSSSTGTGNINGYLTILRPEGGFATTQNLVANAPNPGDPSAVFPEFILWGDVTADGQFATNDVALARAFLLFQAVPTTRQQISVDVVPANGNGSRGNGQLTSTDFSLLRAVSFGQTTF
ncbi:MAG: IPT/TIG domain-containing protein [Blastocatellia bacterium]|nr:IPT/TIG domain-containing protein [Blastocatellia bacterium]